MQELEKILEEIESEYLMCRCKNNEVCPYPESIGCCYDRAISKVSEIIRKHLSRENGQEIMGIKIRDNETGEIFEYGTNIHHALRISKNGGCLTFENLQNGDGSLKSGDGGYSFVLNDGRTPEESSSPDSMYGATYANIGGFHRGSTKNDGWIPVEESLPEEGGTYIVTALEDRLVHVTFAKWQNRLKRFDMTGARTFWKAIAWKPLPEPYHQERSRENEK